MLPGQDWPDILTLGFFAMARILKRSIYREPRRNITQYIYRHPETGKIVVQSHALDNETVFRMGVKLIACQCFGE